MSSKPASTAPDEVSTFRRLLPQVSEKKRERAKDFSHKNAMLTSEQQTHTPTVPLLDFVVIFFAERTIEIFSFLIWYILRTHWYRATLQS